MSVQGLVAEPSGRGRIQEDGDPAMDQHLVLGARLFGQRRGQAGGVAVACDAKSGAEGQLGFGGQLLDRVGGLLGEEEHASPLAR